MSGVVNHNLSQGRGKKVLIDLVSDEDDGNNVETVHCDVHNAETVNGDVHNAGSDVHNAGIHDNVTHEVNNDSESSDDGGEPIPNSASEEDKCEGKDADGFDKNVTGTAEALFNVLLKNMKKSGGTSGIEQTKEFVSNDAGEGSSKGGFHDDHHMEDGWQSEELLSMSSGDDEEYEAETVIPETKGYYAQFHPEDMSKDFQFHVGMEFTSIKQFKERCG